MNRFSVLFGNPKADAADAGDVPPKAMGLNGMSGAGQSQLRRHKSTCHAGSIALDTGNLHQSGYRIAYKPQYVFDGNGDAMSSTLKETAEGGLAATPTGRRLHEQVFGTVREPKSGCSGCGGCSS